MHLHTSLVTFIVALPALVLAHGHGVGGLKIFGRNAIADLRRKNVLPGPIAGPFVRRKSAPDLPGRRDANANTDGQCGAGFNPSSCAPGYCCSPAVLCPPPVTLVYTNLYQRAIAASVLTTATVPTAY